MAKLLLLILQPCHWPCRYWLFTPSQQKSWSELIQPHTEKNTEARGDIWTIITIYILSSLLSQPLYTYRTVHTMPRSVEAVHRDQEVYYSQECRDVILRKPKTFKMKLSRSYLISSDFNQQEFVLHKHSQVYPVNTCVAYFRELAYQDEVAIFSEQSCWKLSRV